MTIIDSAGRVRGLLSEGQDGEIVILLFDKFGRNMLASVAQNGPEGEEFATALCDDFLHKRLTANVRNGKPRICVFDADGVPTFSLLGCRGQALAAAEAVETPTSKPRILPTKN